MLLAERLYHFSSWRELLRVRMPFYASLFVAWLCAGIWFLGGARMEDLTVGGPLSTPLGYLTAQCREVFNYFRLVVFPDPLIFYRAPEAAGSVTRWVPYAMGLVLIAAAVVAMGKRHRWVCLAGGLAAAILLPTSSVIPLAIEPSAEFRMYLPSAPAIALLVAGAWSLVNRTGVPASLPRIGVAAVAVTLGAITYERATVFSSRETLWADTAFKQPFNVKAWANLAGAQIDAGHYEQAGRTARHLERALGGGAGGTEWLARIHGAVALGAGEWEEAERHYLDAIQHDPRNGALYAGLAEAQLELGRPDEALASADAALALDPLLPSALKAKYDIFIAQGEGDRALEVKRVLDSSGLWGVAIAGERKKKASPPPQE